VVYAFVVLLVVLGFVWVAIALDRQQRLEKAAIDAEVQRYRMARLPEVPRRLHGGSIMVSLRSPRRGGGRGGIDGVDAYIIGDALGDIFGGGGGDCGGSDGGGGGDGGCD